MSSRDDKSSSSTPELFGAVPRRGFLKYLSAVFATAALPEALTACANLVGAPAAVGTTAEEVDLSTVPMIWVTRSTDNLSLGFQFSGLAPNAARSLALTSGTTAGSAYVAITFPPQHVIEDAVAAGASDTLPLNTYASGTSRLVFEVPASYGTAADAGGIPLVPYTLQGVLDLCAQCPLVVAGNAMSNAGTTVGGPVILAHAEGAARVASFAQARIDRVVAKVDPAAAKRVLARLKKPDPELIIIHPTHYGTAPVAPTSGQTSIELPHRLLISPNETTAWSYSAVPMTSPENRTELWNARLGLRNPATGLADPGLGGLTARALWTRDYEVYGPTVPATATDPVANAVLTPPTRDRIVQDTGNMAGAATPPLPVSRLMLTPLGGTLDVAATFADLNLQSWTQRITLGRDEYVETITLGTLLPFGHPAAVVKINKRCDNPATGTVGTIYNTDYLIVGQPVMSYQGLPNQADFNTFPFVAVELTQTKIPCSINVGTVSGWVVDPSGNAPYVGVIGTDHKGRAIKFTTPLVFSPGSSTPATAAASLSQAMQMWNGGGDGGPGGYTFEGQRVAFAPPPSASSPSTANSTDSTSFEAQTFAIPVKLPSTPSSVPVVPWMRWITVSLDAVRHLTTSTSTGTGTPASAATFDYDQVAYAANGFDPTSNPNEVFFTVSANTTAPNLQFSSDASKSGALVTPNMPITALSRANGTMGGGSSLFSGGFDATDFFGQCNPQLFGFVPLTSIIQSAAASFPKVVSQQLSNAEAFLQKAMALYQLVTSTATQLQALAAQAGTDATSYTALAASGLNAAGTPLTPAEKSALQAAAAAATAAQKAIAAISTSALATDSAAVENDVTNQLWSALLGTTGMNGDLGRLLGDVTTLVSELPAAASSYTAALANGLTKATAAAESFLSGAAQILLDLETLSQGLELPQNLSVELTWRPQIAGLEYAGLIAFVPGTDQALSLDVQVNAAAMNGQPAGANITCRLDQFAIAFGGSIFVPTTPSGPFRSFTSSQYSVQQAIQTADVTLVFDHMQFQMLAGQKPEVDVVFDNIYFGGDLKFIETLKDLLPLDAFSDPPFVDVTTSGITAGFNLAVPNVALGMFSIENIAIDASLTIPFVTTTGNGISFNFDFCTIDNPFLVTVAMLGGGGFFGMKMDMSGLTRVALGVEVSAQLAISLLDIVSGSVSIEVGIFIVYNSPSALGTGDAGIDPVTQEPEAAGWLIGGYLRLRGELDIAGIITISVELYLQVIYSLTTGKCTASGHIRIDVSLFFFSLDVDPAFSRTFAGSNGDPTFVQLMAAGGVDPMIDPTLGGSIANSGWDPLAEYCMAFA